MSQAQTPQSSYTGPIVVDPITRIEGHLRIEVEVENGRVKDARSAATLFRGLEMILKGRDPRDAQHFTQRTCGVCTYTHALASTRALEDAIGVEIPRNATAIRNLVLGMQYLHDHVVHFYHLHALDFVDVTAALKADPVKAAQLNASISGKPLSAETLKTVQTKVRTLVDSGQLGPFTNAYFLGGHPAYYLDPETNLVATAHYLEALRKQVKIAQAMAVFGAKKPAYPVHGGGRRNLLQRAEKGTSRTVRGPVQGNAGIRGAVLYSRSAAGGRSLQGLGRHRRRRGELHDIRSNLPGDERRLETRWLKPGVILDRKIDTILPFDPSRIEEHVRHSWYEGEQARAPYEGETAPKFTSMGDTDR
mgnify:CR=1 FL=1